MPNAEAAPCTVCLLHWKPEEAEERLAQLREAGFDAYLGPAAAPALAADMLARRPDAVLIDLTRLPSQGREVGVFLRLRKGTRAIPMVFVGGEPDKVERVRQVLPDAGFAQWATVGDEVRCYLADPPLEPHAPSDVYASYAGRPLAAKLGIKPGMAVALVDAPDDFAAALGDLPEGASLHPTPGPQCRLSVWFMRSAECMEARWRDVLAQAEHGPVWIAWPKQAGGLASDLTQNLVRERILASRLVDYKIASIDADWTGLLSRKRAKG